MYKEMGKMKKRLLLLYTGAALLAGLLYGCSGKVPASGEKVVTEATEEKENKTQSEEAVLEQLAKGDRKVSADELADYGSGTALIDAEEPGQMTYSLVMPQIPESDDAYFYLFTAECYEDMQELSGDPEVIWEKGKISEVSFDYDISLGNLFLRFLWREDMYRQEEAFICQTRKCWRRIRIHTPI